MAVDTRTGEVLASLEHVFMVSAGGSVEEIRTFGIERTFKRVMATMANGVELDIHPISKLHSWALVYWHKWVPVKWKQHLAIQHGGGAHWPNKVIGVGEWDTDDEPWCYEHGTKEHRK